MVQFASFFQAGRSTSRRHATDGTPKFRADTEGCDPGANGDMEGTETHTPLMTEEEVSDYQAAITLTSPAATGSLCERCCLSHLLKALEVER